MTLFEVDEAATRIRERSTPMPTSSSRHFRPGLAGKFRVSVVASGTAPGAEVFNSADDGVSLTTLEMYRR